MKQILIFLLIIVLPGLFAWFSPRGKWWELSAVGVLLGSIALVVLLIQVGVLR